jgi:hypothetical protein
MATTRATLSAALTLNNSAFKKGINNSRKEVNKFSNSMKSLGGIMAGAFTARAIMNFAIESSKLAAQMEGVANAFERIKPGVYFLEELKQATAGTVSELALMKRAVMASNFKIPMEQLSSLMQFATKRAQETGESVDYLVNSIVIGIGRKSPLILDNLGISAVELREKLDHVGHSGATVGDVAKAVGDIATTEMGKMGDIVETTAIKYERLSAEITDFKVDLGNAVNEIVYHMIPALEAFGREVAVIGRWLKNVWLGPQGQGIFTGENIFQTDKQLKDSVGEKIRVVRKHIQYEAKRFEGQGMSAEEAMKKALTDMRSKVLNDLIGSDEGTWRNISEEILRDIEKQIKEFDKYGLEGIAGAENIENLEAELKVLQEIQKVLPRHDPELKKIAARMKEIAAIIDEIKGKTKESKKESREFVSALELLHRSAQSGYNQAAEYFKKLAEESAKVRKEINSYLYDNEEVWAGGREEWEDFADDMETQEEIMKGMKDAIKRELIDSFHALGTAIGETMAGIEGSLKKLAITIASNIGYILMMAGVQMLAVNPALGVGLLIAGGALQLGSGMIRGLDAGSKVPGGVNNAANTNVNFKISGKDLVAVIDRQGYSNNMNT